MRNDLKAILIILIFAIVLSLPLLKPGLHIIHDDQQITRLFVFDQALESGQFPVRWVDGLGFGFGYPLFVFYPPLVYALGEFFHILGFSLIASVKLVFFLSIILSGFAMYVLVKEFYGRLEGVVSSLFYMLVPYRAVDIYVRGALAESFSFVWLPLILWSFYQHHRTGSFSYIILGGLFLALLMITHNLIFLPFMMVFLPYLLFLIVKSKNKKQTIVYYLSSFCLALGLSAFFWIPAIAEKKYTIVDELLLVNLASYKIHFVYPQQLWNWTWGFGGSAQGLTDGISFKIGKLHILASIGTLIMSLIHLIINKKLSTFNFQLSTFFFTLLALAAFMTTFYSQFIWDLIKPLGYLQFPWRFLTFTALFSSILAGSLINSLRLTIVKLTASALLIILLVVPNLKLFNPQDYRKDLDDAKATAKETINWEVSQSSFEYLPKGVSLYKGSLGTNLVEIEKTQIPQSKIEIIAGNGQIKNLKYKPTYIDFAIEAHTPIQLRANVFNFPGWKAYVNGSETIINDNNKLKLAELFLPSGIHDIKLEFQNTKIRSFANLLSLMVVFLLIILLSKKWQFQKI